MKKHIAIVSTIGAGKTTASKYFQSKGFIYYRLSKALYDEIGRRGMDPQNRIVLQDVADEMRKELGAAVLAIKGIEYFSKYPGESYVIDSIRNHNELIELKKKYGDNLLILAIDAPIELRYKRVVSRPEYNDKEYTFEDFKKINKRDLGVGNKENEQNNQKCLDMAEVFIHNDGSLEEFYVKLDEVYRKYFA